MTRGLPVLRTCGGCRHCDARSTSATCMHPKTRGSVVRAAPEPPPDWCPLPRAEPDRELLRALVRAGAAASGWENDNDDEIDQIADAVLAARRQR